MLRRKFLQAGLIATAWLATAGHTLVAGHDAVGDAPRASSARYRQPS